ncbi:hypothetical protein C900_05897 [Fulvivirga imtechensis AK7]|uniref:histidine kinase n=1 Tax=Fulvivirga imtechensis AK7 TaxID=1237149 RepID=L8JMG9_9BACT|nr:sensor histidine kinase [Fulvivirga imtechensis]ELR68714.1 hypothetical protein C900_05897 [Fulvivirga imtechensis AK7]
MSMCRLINNASAFVFLFFSILFTEAEAQGSYWFRNYSIEEGLSQETVNCIYQDSKGFMWFGTLDGLNKFDGYSFTAYRHSAADSSSIVGNYIVSIDEDGNGNMWILTRRGVSMWDRDQQKFRSYNVNSIKASEYTALQVDQNNTVWIGTRGDGIFLIKDDQVVHIPYMTKISEGTHKNITALYSDPLNNMWIGTEQHGLIIYNITTDSFKEYIHNPADENSISNNNIWSIYGDSKGHVWLVPIQGPLSRYDYSKDIFKEFSIYTEASDNISITQICEGYKGDFWIGTFEDGLLNYNFLTQRSTFYRPKSGNRFSIGSDLIMALYRDKMGNIWIGTSGGGVSKLSQEETLFALYQHDIFDPASLPDNSVWAIGQDRSGVVWVGTAKGLSRFYRIQGIFREFKLEGIKGSNAVVQCIYADQDDNLYVGVYHEGLKVLSKDREFVRSYKHDPGSSASLSNDDVFCITEDKYGDIWVGTWNGLNKFNKKTGEFKHYFYNNEDSGTISNNTIFSIYEDKSGTVWIGTGGGLNRYNEDNDTFTRYLADPLDSTTLSNNYVLTISEDSNGNLWIGTYGGGLNYFDRGRQVFIHYSESDGLSNNYIYGILKDAQNDLWMSTNRGISFLDVETFTFTNYDITDGLQSNEFTQGAFAKANNGDMYFGGIKGLNIINPQQVFLARTNISTQRAPLAFIDFQLFNKSVLPSPAGLLKRNINEVESITLPYQQNNFGFSFSLLNYQNVYKTNYSYMLVGFDETWNEVGNKHSASYTNIDPGEYTFKVRAAGLDGTWVERYIMVYITPPFWQLWWFRLSVFIFSCGIVYLMIRTRTSVLRKQKAHLEKVVRERTREIINQREEISFQKKEIEQQKNELEVTNDELRDKNEKLVLLNKERDEFLGIFAHDVIDPLMSIQVLGVQLRKNAVKYNGSDIENIGRRIEFNAAHISSLTSNMLKAGLIESGRINLKIERFNIIQVIKGSVVEFAQKALEKNIMLQADYEPGKIYALADKAAVTQIIQNLLSNAIKYTQPGKNIYVKVGQIRNFCRVSVKDEGIGFTEEDKRKAFTKFSKLSARPTGGEPSTGLGLYIVKMLAEKIRGKLWFESMSGRGSTFYVELPLSIDSEEGGIL